MGKEEEEMGARSVQKDSSSGITPLLELFLETRAGATLTDKLLESICKLDERYMTSDHQDCQEFLVHLCNGLIEEEEELLERLPDLQKDVCTVVDSIFREEKKAAASLPSIKECLEYYFRKEEVQKRREICEKPSSSQSKDGEQIVANISGNTSLDRAQAERDHHRKVEEKNNLLSDQDRTKQVELENTAQQVGEDPSMQINMGGPADKTLSLSKLPPVLTIHVLRFNINDKRSEHVKFDENLDVGEYLDPRSGDRDNARYQQVCGKEVPDVIREIASRLPCDLAIAQMACSGSSWAAALREVGFHVPGANAKLPWLQMPHPGGPVFFCISCGGGDSAQHTIGIAEDQRWARYVSAFEGFWIVAAGTRIGRNRIFNLRTGASFRLPDQAVNGGNVQQLILLATTLSCAPDEPNCMGMGIIKYLANLQQTRRVVFFTPGSETAVDHFPGEYFDEPEDLSYHDSSFWILTTNEHVHRWDMALQPDGDITLEKWRGFFFPDDLDHGDHVLGRYIVPSRGEVLMVIRLSSCGAGGLTTKFRIYKMTVVLMGEGEDEPARCHWNELSSLAGRMLFIGRGCSRCYEASDYPRLTEGIYFCDGRRSFNAEDIVNNLEVPCSDTGRWLTQTPIDRCFPQEYDLSSYSSSGWVLQ